MTVGRAVFDADRAAVEILSPKFRRQEPRRRKTNETEIMMLVRSPTFRCHGAALIRLS